MYERNNLFQFSNNAPNWATSGRNLMVGGAEKWGVLLFLSSHLVTLVRRPLINKS